jgi:putative ABC transport system permease protein
VSGPIPGGDRPSAGVRYRQALGRWRLALRLAWRDLRQHSGRAVLIAVMVALPVAAGSFLVTVLESNTPYGPADAEAELGPGLQAKIEGIGGPIEQFHQESGQWFWDPVGWNTYYEDDLVSTAYVELERRLESHLPDGDRLVRALKGEVRLDDGDGAAMSVAVQTDFAEPDVASRFPVLEGRLPRDGEIAITEHHRDLGFDLGDTVEVELTDGTTTTATISGVGPRYIDRISPVLLPASGPLSPPQEVTSAGSDIPLWYVTGDAPVTWSHVQAMNAAGAFVTSRDVLLDPPPLPAPAAPSWSGYVDWESVSVIVALVVVGLLEAVWLIGPAFAVGARRDTRSLALLAVNGAPAPALRAVMLARGLLTGTAGSVAGVGLGIAAAGVLVLVIPERLPALRLPEASLAGVLAVGVLLAVVSAWPPARRAARADVATALSGRRPEVSAARWPTAVGAAAALGGVVLAVVAGSQRWVIGLSAGIVVADLGLILACGGIVALAARLARRMPWAWRFALRDAARYRARTVPAIAAVLVAVAGATAALTYLAAEDAAVGQQRYQPWASTGTVALTRGPGLRQVFSGDEAERLQSVVAEVLPDADPLMAVPVAVGSAGERASARRSAIELFVRPVDAAHDLDAVYTELDRWPGAVVSDGSDRALLRALGIREEHLDDVGAALAAGRLPLPPSLVDEDGTATVHLLRSDGTGGPDTEDTMLPAAAVGSPGDQIPNLPILPEALLDELDAETAVGAYLAQSPAVPSNQQVTLLRNRVDAEIVGFDREQVIAVSVETGEAPDRYASSLVPALITPWTADNRPVIGLAVALAAVFLALAGTWSAVALSAVDARPDLATLAAVGAAPSTRRRVVAAQAATISVTGSVLGLVAGALIGVGWTLLSGYAVAVPWLQVAALAVAVPVLAAAAAWTVTRSRVTLARRRP